MECGGGITRAYCGVNEDVCNDRMQRVVANFVKGRDSGRCSVRVGYCVSKFFVDMGCSKGFVRVCSEVDKSRSAFSEARELHSSQAKKTEKKHFQRENSLPNIIHIREILVARTLF